MNYCLRMKTHSFLVLQVFENIAQAIWSLAFAYSESVPHMCNDRIDGVVLPHGGSVLQRLVCLLYGKKGSIVAAVAGALACAASNCRSARASIVSYGGTTGIVTSLCSALEMRHGRAVLNSLGLLCNLSMDRQTRSELGANKQGDRLFRAVIAIAKRTMTGSGDDEDTLCCVQDIALQAIGALSYANMKNAVRLTELGAVAACFQALSACDTSNLFVRSACHTLMDLSAPGVTIASIQATQPKTHAGILKRLLHCAVTTGHSHLTVDSRRAIIHAITACCCDVSVALPLLVSMGADFLSVVSSFTRSFEQQSASVWTGAEVASSCLCISVALSWGPLSQVCRVWL